MAIRFGYRSIFESFPTRDQQTDAFMRATIAKSYSQKVNFDKATRFDELDGLITHLKSEVDEFSQAVVNGESKTRQLDELGDILYITNWLGNFKGLNGKDALHHAADKFINRMRTIEGIVQQRWGSKPLPSLQKKQWLDLWKEAKQRLEGRSP